MHGPVPIRAQFQADSCMQLRNHPNPLVARQAELALQSWEKLQPEDLPQDISMGMPVARAVERLKEVCSGLPDGHASLARLNNVLIPLLIVSRTMDLSVVSSFRRLGAGSFATVFVSEGRGGAVVKQVKDPSNIAQLEKEYGDLEHLYNACASTDMFFSLPRPYGFYHDYWTFAKAALIPRTVDLGLPPHAMYVMQRIWPTPTSVTEQIRQLFFPDRVRDEPFEPFLSRLYLGRGESRADSRFFCSENYPLDASRIDQLGLPASKIAAGMGQMLARINFQTGKDGRDIEFVLCGDPGNPLSGHPSFSCIDFNQMRPHNYDANNIVSSIDDNDPYYPRPSSPHWSSFTDAYMEEAAAAPPPAAEVAHHVVDQLRALWTK